MPEQHSGKRGQSMDYKLVISEHADELLDNLVYYLLYRLKSEQAARHLLDGIDGIYDRLHCYFCCKRRYCKCCWCFSSIGKISKQVIVKQR